ncbi:MAG TPA: DUF5677 domain-containing protein [Syntrophorhabdaceae bacterium]
MNWSDLTSLLAAGYARNMNNKFTKSNFEKVSQEALDFQLATLYPVKVDKDHRRNTLLFLNHDRNFSTFLTVMYLVEHGRVADIYALSRAMFESIVSMGLLVTSAIPDDLKRYETYQFVEAYKCYSHLEKLGLGNLSGIPPSEIASLKQNRDRYLKTYGKNVTSWTGKSLEQNVGLLDSRYPPTCNEPHFYEYLYCQAYRQGSPSAHSSFAGLAKGVRARRVDIPGSFVANQFETNEPHLIFSSFHSLLVFLSSVRFMGQALGKPEVEEHFHKLSRYVIAE